MKLETTVTLDKEDVYNALFSYLEKQNLSVSSEELKHELDSLSITTLCLHSSISSSQRDSATEKKEENETNIRPEPDITAALSDDYVGDSSSERDTNSTDTTDSPKPAGKSIFITRVPDGGEPDTGNTASATLPDSSDTDGLRKSPSRGLFAVLKKQQTEEVS